MLETLTQGFKAAQERLGGVAELTDENIDEALRNVRMSLLEADVDLPLVREFLAKVKERALGEKVGTRVRDASGRMVRVTPGQHFVASCEQELVALMGPVDTKLSRDSHGVISIMLLGLQGVGKTTVAAKLGKYLQRDKGRPLLVAADVYRPAAVLQLQQLGDRIGVAVHTGDEGQRPPAICAAAAARARREGFSAVIYDTAGRLAIDDELMQELEQIVEHVAPANTLLVCDSLMGRDAVTVAKAFSERLTLDGLVLTKLDGDSRGGAALAVKAVTGIPIKFLGTGEALERLEPFRPEGLASRILGMGDVVGLVQDFEAVVDEQEAAKAEEDAERMLRGHFTLDDFLSQLKMIRRMGPLQEIFAKLPGFGAFANQVEGDELTRVEAVVQSMTRTERADPKIIDRSRASRIAQGSGRTQSEVRELTKRFLQMKKMLGSLGGGGLASRIPGMSRLAGAGGGAGMDPAALLEGHGGGSTRRQEATHSRRRQKKKRKDARKARKKGRRH